MYLHGSLLFVRSATNPSNSNDHKKEANHFVSNVRSWKLPFEDRQNARLLQRAFAFVFLEIHHFEIFHVSHWLEQIANAMIYNMLVQFFLYMIY